MNPMLLNNQSPTQNLNNHYPNPQEQKPPKVGMILAILAIIITVIFTLVSYYSYFVPFLKWGVSSPAFFLMSLAGLIIPTLTIVVLVKLIKLKKWALFAFSVLVIIKIVGGIRDLLMIRSEEEFILSTPLENVLLVVSIIIDITAVVYFWSIRKKFVK